MITLNGTTGITNDGGYTGDGVVFADTTPANTLVTTTGGNVGIGTSSPNYRLDVAGAANTTAMGTTLAYGTAGEVYSSFRFNNSSFAGGNSEIRNIVNGATSTGSALAFFTTQTGSGPLTERMRLDSSGNLLVGTLSSGGRVTVSAASGSVGIAIPQNSSSRAIVIDQTNANTVSVDFLWYGSRIGSISTNGASTAYNTTSDYRLKENIQPMNGALATVAALKPVTYNWKSTGEGSQGFIAHELAEVVPDCVMGEKDAVDAEGKPIYQGIDTSFLVATLTAAIQEQQAIITALTARVAALEGK